MSLQTQNQKRAKFVIENIAVFKQSPYSEKLSSYILTNGLLPTLAFIKGKDNNMYNAINQYFQMKNICINDLLGELTQTDVGTLRYATMEAMELANWIRRLVKSEKNQKEGED